MGQRASNTGSRTNFQYGTRTTQVQNNVQHVSNSKGRNNGWAGTVQGRLLKNGARIGSAASGATTPSGTWSIWDLRRRVIVSPSTTT
jgi:hypothetical protein